MISMGYDLAKISMTALMEPVWLLASDFN